MKKILLSLFALLLLGQVGMAQVLQTQGFEDGSMPPTGWSAVTSSLSYWHNVTTSSTYGGTPSGVSPHSGSKMAIFNSYSWSSSGSYQTFSTPAFTRAAFTSATADSMSFWIYRDGSYSSNDDDIIINIDSSATMATPTLVGSVARSTSIAEPVTVSSNGWYQYTFAIPSGYTGTTNYLFFKGVTQYGGNIYIDDISYYSYPPLCTGATAGTITGPTIACPSTSFTLGLTGDSLASGLSYVWKASTDGGTTFTAVSGATNSIYTVASQTVPTSYELVVTCSAGGSDSTPAFAIGETVCYCTTPSWYTGTPIYEAMSGLTLAGYSGDTLVETSIATSASSSTGYLDRTTDTVNLQQGGTYPLAVTFNASENHWENQSWIDFNDDGIYADSEAVTSVFGYSTSTPSTSASTMLTVPIAATVGYHHMRVRNTWLLSGSGSVVSAFMDPCAESDADESYYSGDVIDFIADIIMAPPCTGMPTAGTIAGPSSSCLGIGYTLSLTGDSIASGLSIQWYADTAGGAFLPITGATGTSYTSTTGSSNLGFEVVVKCIASGDADTTPVFNYGPSPFYLCYCGPLSDGTVLNSYAYPTIHEVAIGGTTLDNVTTTGLVYQQFWPVTTTTTATLSQGSTYTAVVNSTGTVNYMAAMWIDLDRNGSFDDVPEFTDVTSASGDDAPSGTSSAAVFTMPVTGYTADTGLTGMRIRVIPYYYSYDLSSSDACTNIYDGATQDYIVNIVPGIPCTGTPAGGTAIASPASVCPTTPFALSDTGYTNGLGLEYQWYYRTTGATGAYTAISGATSAYYSSPTGVTTATDYIFVVKCDSSSLYDTSSTVTITTNPFYLCYCGPLSDGTVLDNYADPTIHEFAIAGTTLDHVDATSLVYQRFWPTTPSTTTTLNQGSTYTAQISSNDYVNFMAVMWIDYDHSGTFDDGTEYTDITASSSDDAPYGTTPATASFLVPSAGYLADTGYTGLRLWVIPYYYSYDMDGTEACTNIYDGSVEDYVINIAPGVPCTGTPSSGTAAAGVTSACPGTAIVLSDTGFTNGLGLQYQWYRADSGTTTYTTISGATTSYYSYTGQTVATNYIFVVKCDSSGLYDTSNIVTVSQSPFYLCYCGPLSDGTALDNYADPTIHEFTIAGTTLDHVDATSLVYQRFWPVTASTTAYLNQGSTYTAQVTSNDYVNFMAVMWIDYDHSGTFDDGTEYTDITASSSDDAPYGTTPAAATFYVPTTGYLADTGATGLRLRVIPYYYSYDMSGSDACTDVYDGSTEDYVINIQPGIPCTGTPSGGTAMTTAVTVCPGSSFPLSDTGFSNGLGLEYHWYRANTGTGIYTAITGATSSYYTMTGQTVSTDYVFVVKCDSSGLYDTSNIVTVGQNPYYLCYCGPATGTTIGSYGGYVPIEEVSISGTTLDHVDGSGAAYTELWPTTASTTTTLQQAVTYTVNVTASGYDSYNAGMWIDYDHSATFDSPDALGLEEFTLVASTAAEGSTTSVTFTIPATADTGLTGLRIRVFPSYESLGDGDACTNNYDECTQDYVITIAPGVACSGTPTAGVAIAPTGACPGSMFTLSDTTLTTGFIGITYQWQSSPEGSGVWTNIAGATNPTYSSTTEDTATDYRMIVVCSGTGTPLADTSAAILVVINPAMACVCTTPTWVFSDDPITDYSMSDFSLTGCSGAIADFGINDAADPITGYVDHTFDTVSLMQGGTYTASFDFTYSSMEFETQAWIDNGNDGIFDPTDTVSEVMGFSTDDASSATGTIFIPAAEIPGFHRMRVRNAWLQWSSYDGSDASDPMDPCASGDAFVNYGTGDVVDYTVYIVPTVCDTVLTLTASSITDTTATVSWNSGTAMNYEYTVNDTLASPTVAGTVTTDTSLSLTGLTAGATYYVHVRTACGCGTLSAWETIMFHTGSCDTVVGLTASDISDTGAIITWTGTSTGYEYTIDNIPTAPTVAGIATTALSDTITTLSPGTTYYAHVRSSCFAGVYSAWVTIPITTGACDTVLGLLAGSSDSGAFFAWDAATGAAGYQYIINTSTSTPLASGTFTTDTSVFVDTLAPGVTYYAHVRVVCGGGNYSGWIEYPITELPCDMPTFVMYNITDSTASVTWSAASGSPAASFEYAIDNNPTPPTVGTVTTANADTAIGLTCNTLYYVHVRVHCGGGIVSPWFTDTFSTKPCFLSVQVVNGNPFDVQAYPNPARDVVTVQVSGVLGNNRQVELTDVTGKVIAKVKMLTDKVDVSMNNLAAGIYLIRYSDDTHTQVIKVNKQ